jgi:hypothetical protein
MTFSESNDNAQEFRIALVVPQRFAVVVATSGHRRHFPTFRVSAGARPAQQLQQLIQETYRVKAVVIDFLPQSHHEPRCAACEILSPSWNPDIANLESVSLDDLDGDCLSLGEHDILNRIISGDTEGRCPLSKMGWVEEAKTWIQDVAPRRPIQFNEDLKQLNAGGQFALVRFGTDDGPAFWLKATGIPNAHELEVTQTIASFCPQFLPPIIAKRRDWNAWVSEEAGEPLAENLRLAPFERAAEHLAQLQIATTRHIPQFLDAGCFDHRTPVLRAHLPDMIEYLKNAMGKQTSTRAPRLANQRLDELGIVLERACIVSERIGIPDAIIHNDMNASNILIDGDRALFTDWSEACIGNPFLTFQHLQIQAGEVDTTRYWVSKLRTIYRDNWRSILSDLEIDAAFALSPPLAIVSYLLGRDPEFQSPYRQFAKAQSYSRTLARYIDCFVHAPSFREAICD